MGGYFTPTTGTTISTTDHNTYVRDQTVNQFASSAARASAISSPSEGMITYLADTNSFEYYTGAAWERFELRPRTTIVRRTTNQSINNTTLTPISFTSETVDNASMIAVTSDTITLSTAGVWLISGGLIWALSGGGDRLTYIEHAGAEIEGGGNTLTNSAANTIRTSVTCMVLAAASDTVKLVGYQSTGGALNVASARLGCMLLSKV